MNTSRRVLPAISTALLCSVLAACQKAPEANSAPRVEPPSPPEAKAKAVSPTGFDAVTKQLDAGGEVFLYLSTEGFLKACSDAFRQCGEGAPDQRARIKEFAKAAKPLLQNSGIREISGFGLSSIEIRPGVYRSKAVIHHRPSEGFLWKMSGGGKKALEFASCLPSTTALASSFNLTLEPLWGELEREAATSGPFRAVLDTLMQKVLASAGLELPKLLAGVGPGISYFITLDPEKPFPVPLPGGAPFSIPRPALLAQVEIRDEAVIACLESNLARDSKLTQADYGDYKVRKIPAPPLPFLAPVIAWKPGVVILSSSEALLHEMLEIKEGKKQGLAATEDFKDVSAGLPSPASMFTYVSPLFTKTAAEFQLRAMDVQSPGNRENRQLIAAMLAEIKMPAASVGQETPEGWVFVRQGGMGLREASGLWAKMFLAGMMRGGIEGATRSQLHREAVMTRDQLRLIQAASEQWAIEKEQSRGAQPTTDDLKAYIKPGTPLYRILDRSPGATEVVLIQGMPAVAIPKIDAETVIPASLVERFKQACPDDFWQGFEIR